MVNHTGHTMLTPGQQPTSAQVADIVVAFFNQTLG
jgi:hypothetical protein